MPASLSGHRANSTIWARGPLTVAMPASLSGHRANSTIWARGPLTATLSMVQGTATVRPTESVKVLVSGACGALAAAQAVDSSISAASSKVRMRFMFFPPYRGISRARMTIMPTDRRAGR